MHGMTSLWLVTRQASGTSRLKTVANATLPTRGDPKLTMLMCGLARVVRYLRREGAAHLWLSPVCALQHLTCQCSHVSQPDPYALSDCLLYLTYHVA